MSEREKSRSRLLGELKKTDVRIARLVETASGVGGVQSLKIMEAYADALKKSAAILKEGVE